MLEFIVLGQIPGTEIYLSFEMIMLISISLIMIYFGHRMAKTAWRAQLDDIRQKQYLIFRQTI